MIAFDANTMLALLPVVGTAVLAFLVVFVDLAWPGRDGLVAGVAAVGTVLLMLLVALIGPFELVKFPSGQSNPTYRIRAASGDYVLRRKPFGKLLPSAHAVDREYRLLSALHPLDFPVPRPLALCDDPEVIAIVREPSRNRVRPASKVVLHEALAPSLPGSSGPVGGASQTGKCRK